MGFTVSENVHSYYLAMLDADGKPNWAKVVGHIITIENFKFGVAAIPDDTGSFELNISEITTGAKVQNLKNNPIIDLITSTKEGVIRFYETTIADYLKTIIQSSEFESELARCEGVIKSEFGPMPELEEYADDFITDPASEYLN